MASKQTDSKIERARRYLSGGGVTREDSDDELGLDDHPWEWIYAPSKTDDGVEPNAGGKRPRKSHKVNGAKTDAKPVIIGARMGKFECRVGDTVLLKADGKQAWVGLICAFSNDAETDEKLANFMWFSTQQEIRNKAKKRTDFSEVMHS